MESSGKEAVMLNIMRKVMELPGARVDRRAFLKKEFRPYLYDDKLNAVLESNPKKAGVNANLVERIADGCKQYHLTICSGTSFCAGLPGGWWAAGTIPADITQFFYHATVLSQKLLYLYGWPDLFDDEEFEGVSDETLLKIILFIGVMMGAAGANKVVAKIAEELAKETTKRLPRYALTKYAVYNLVKQIARWIGVKMTKETFAKQVGKVIPVLGGAISGTITLVTFRPMAGRLQNHLKDLPLAI